MADLISDIYEAAVINDRWEGVLDRLCQRFGTRAAMIINLSDPAEGWLSGGWLGSRAMPEMMAVALSGGWLSHPDNDRIQRLMRLSPAGFCIDLDLYTPEELRQNRMYQQFLFPNGIRASAASEIRASETVRLLVTLEGFADHASATAALPGLNALRPHLKRALGLSAHLGIERAQSMTGALRAVGLPACVLDTQGRLKAANDLFTPLFQTLFHDTPVGVRPRDEKIARLFSHSLLRFDEADCTALSLPMTDPVEDRARIIHLLPVTGMARDVLGGRSVLMVVTGGGQRTAVHTSLLSALFNLTPAESLITQAIADGLSPAAIAETTSRSLHTVRTQLKAVFAKTGVANQRELLRLLGSLTLNGE